MATVDADDGTSIGGGGTKEFFGADSKERRRVPHLLQVTQSGNYSGIENDYTYFDSRVYMIIDDFCGGGRMNL